MYSTCLFCHAKLGANEAIEHFPIGRRLAFDAAKGRLWAVCRKCERWNLTPIEERWEAIEECERAYRSTKLRVSTEHIGLARLGEGSELVRIGKPQRPEFAAWRYGDQFGRRRRKHFIQTGGVLVATAAIPILGVGVGIGGVGVSLNLFNISRLTYSLLGRTRTVARVRDEDETLLLVRTHEIRETVMLPPTADSEWGLRVTHNHKPGPGTPWWRYVSDTDTTDIRGEAAIRAAAQLLPQLNRRGASSRQLKEAVIIATQHEDPAISFERAAQMAAKRRSWNEFGQGALLSYMPAEYRLALEMVSHEDAERRALEGELEVLETAWREAEEIAGIADDLFLPAEVSQRLEEMKRSRNAPPLL